MTYGYQWVLGAPLERGGSSKRRLPSTCATRSLNRPRNAPHRSGNGPTTTGDQPSSRQVSSTYSDTMMTHKIYHSLIAALIGAATRGAVKAAPIPAIGATIRGRERRATAVSYNQAGAVDSDPSGLCFNLSNT